MTHSLKGSLVRRLSGGEGKWGVSWEEFVASQARDLTGEDLRREEKGMTEDKMAGWHHRLNGHKF